MRDLQRPLWPRDFRCARLAAAGGVALVLLASLVGASPIAIAASKSSVSVHLTTADLGSRLARQPDLHFRPGPGTSPDNVGVQPRARRQHLTAGFGVAMTDTSAYVLRTQLSKRERKRAMRLLFDPRRGNGLSYLRVPIGGSDYVVGEPYTYDDQPPGQTDPELTDFSIAHDRSYVLPAIREALHLNPKMTVMANPWSPPAWMKTDDSIIPTAAGPVSTLRTDAFGPLARYLVKFLEAYREADVEVDQLGVGNEPLNTFLTQSFPQMYLSAADEARLISDYVGPALRRAKLDSQILGWDFVYPRGILTSPEITDYVPTVVSGARKWIDGLAYHCYLADAGAAAELAQATGVGPWYETECSSYLSDIEPAQMTIRALRAGARGVQLWNAAMDQNFGPKIGQGCAGIIGPHAGQECIAPVIVNTDTHRFALTSDYWALGHFSRFIRLGARRIDSTSPTDCHLGPACGVEDVAFLNPDGTRVVVVTANDGQLHQLTVTERGRHFSYELPAGATATFTWSSHPRH